MLCSSQVLNERAVDTSYTASGRQNMDPIRHTLSDATPSVPVELDLCVGGAKKMFGNTKQG